MRYESPDLFSPSTSERQECFWCFNQTSIKYMVTSYGDRERTTKSGRRLLYSLSPLTESLSPSLLAFSLYALFARLRKLCPFFSSLCPIHELLRSNVMRSTFVARMQPSYIRLLVYYTFSLKLSPSHRLYISPPTVQLFTTASFLLFAAQLFSFCSVVANSVTLLLSFKLLGMSW